MASGPRRRRVEPTDRWEQIELLCGWPEQRNYELIRPLVLFGSPAPRRAEETGVASGRTLRRRAARFEAEGMESLFGSDAARRRKKLPPAMRRLIVDLRAEYPGLNPNEISLVCYVRFGRRPARKTVKRVLAEEPVPLRFVRRFPPYHEFPGRGDARKAVVTLHAEGWSAKAISGYLRVGTSTVYRVLRRWAEEGAAGLEDKPHGRPPGVRKVTLKAMEAIRRFQQNPGLGEYRIHAALAQIGIHLSPRTCGRILALNRELYGLEKPKGPAKEKKEMPFATKRRHQYWSADVRYVDHGLDGRAYVISVLDNHSRAILASTLARTQDLASYLSVLYAAVERYGSPEALVTDGGGIFRARQARAVYEALGIAKHEIERGRPWQNYIETHFNVQRRMADWHFAKAGTWAELAEAHDRFVEDYNAQRHFAHEKRADGRRAPLEVLGFVTSVRHREEELRRAFFSTRFVRVLDSLGYTRFRHWRVYGEEALAGREAALWLAAESLTLEHGGEPLSRYQVRVEAATGELRSVGHPRLFETIHGRRRPQQRLFALDALGEGGWLKALRLDGYAPRAPRGHPALQETLFPYAEAL